MTTPIRLLLPCALSASALLAQQNLTVTGSQCGSSQQAVNSITTAGTCTFSGGSSVKFEAGGSIRLEPGFHAIAGSGSTFDAIAVAQAVTPALSSPTAGGPALAPQTFVLTFSDVLGAGDINSFQVSFGGMGASAGICSLSYYGGVLGLWSNDASQLYTAAPLQNNQCSIGNYAVGRAGTVLTFTVSITFQTSFEGSQEIYALGVSSSGDYHPWVDLAAWNVTAPSTQTDPYNSPGTVTWTAPAGVTSVQVECWGPGGNGANTAVFSNWFNSGGGGGGGAYAKKNSVPVTPGQNYTVVVGAGGYATTTVVADAGVNGSPAVVNGVPGYGGAGGQAANSTGDVVQSGAGGSNGGQPYGGDGGAGGNGGPGGLGGRFPPNGQRDAGQCAWWRRWRRRRERAGCAHLRGARYDNLQHHWYAAGPQHIPTCFSAEPVHDLGGHRPARALSPKRPGSVSGSNSSPPSTPAGGPAFSGRTGSEVLLLTIAGRKRLVTSALLT